MPRAPRMKYELSFIHESELSLNSLPVWLQAAVEAHLLRLAENPVRVPETYPARGYRYGGMVSEFRHGPIDGTIHHFAIYFTISEDQNSLIVSVIAHHEFDENSPGWRLH